MLKVTKFTNEEHSPTIVTFQKTYINLTDADGKKRQNEKKKNMEMVNIDGKIVSVTAPLRCFSNIFILC